MPRRISTPTLQAYWLATDDGCLHRFGQDHSEHPLPADAGRLVAVSGTADGHGCLALDEAGRLHGVGTARAVGDLTLFDHAAAPVDVAAMPHGLGYWLMDLNGSVYAFADAPYLGGVPQVTDLNDTPVLLAPTPTGKGYWIIDRRGGINGFGDMWYDGHLGSYVDASDKVIVGFAPNRRGEGYWLLERYGGVYAIGDAEYLGAPSERGAVDAVALLGDGAGYLLVDGRGMVLAFGDATHRGSLVGQGRRVIAAG